MTPAAWRALAHKHPRRVVYPEFNPDRPQPPWVPVPANRTWWKRTQPRPAQFTTVQQGWPSDPVPALPPSGLGVDIKGAPVAARRNQSGAGLARPDGQRPTDRRPLADQER